MCSTYNIALYIYIYIWNSLLHDIIPYHIMSCRSGASWPPCCGGCGGGSVGCSWASPTTTTTTTTTTSDIMMIIRVVVIVLVTMLIIQIVIVSNYNLFVFALFCLFVQINNNSNWERRLLLSVAHWLGTAMNTLAYPMCNQLKCVYIYIYI